MVVKELASIGMIGRKKKERIGNEECVNASQRANSVGVMTCECDWQW